MANTVYSMNTIGIDVDARDTVPQFTVGASDWSAQGQKLRYVQANGAIAASQSDVAVTTAGQASDGSGTWSNTIAFADNEYGWVYLADNT